MNELAIKYQVCVYDLIRTIIYLSPQFNRNNVCKLVNDHVFVVDPYLNCNDEQKKNVNSFAKKGKMMKVMKRETFFSTFKVE